jgi:hypothetical protein
MAAKIASLEPERFSDEEQELLLLTSNGAVEDPMMNQ